MSLSNKKQSNIVPKIIKNNSEITYEIAGNTKQETKELFVEQTDNKKQIAKSIPIPTEFPVKMILGSPQKIRGTCARIIKAGAKGLIPQTLVNSMVWQLRSLVYFDQMVAELTVTKRLEDLEKAIRIQDRMIKNND